MRVRVILVCTLLLLAASPLFAAPPCRYCDTYFGNGCVSAPYSGEVCWRTTTGCESDFGYCVGRSETPMLTDFKVASIEIHRPSLDSITVTAPAQVAAAELEKPQPAEQK